MHVSQCAWQESGSADLPPPGTGQAAYREVALVGSEELFKLLAGVGDSGHQDQPHPVRRERKAGVGPLARWPRGGPRMEQPDLPAWVPQTEPLRGERGLPRRARLPAGKEAALLILPKSHWVRQGLRAAQPGRQLQVVARPDWFSGHGDGRRVEKVTSWATETSSWLSAKGGLPCLALRGGTVNLMLFTDPLWGGESCERAPGLQKTTLNTFCFSSECSGRDAFSSSSFLNNFGVLLTVQN